MLLLSAMLTPIGRISYSAVATIISVDPPMLYVEPGEYFTINLTITSAVDVYTWEVNMSYDTSVLRFVEATLPSEHFLEGRPQGTSQLQVFELGQTLLLGCTILGEYLGMSGSGTLVTVEFEVLDTGESVLKIDEDPVQTFLLDHNLWETVPGPNLRTDDGYFSNVDHPPIASFTYSPTAPEVNEPITFNASASYDPDGEIVRYEWNFGDGTSINETDEIATHAYPEAKIYTVTLTVIDNITVTQKIMDAFNTTTMPHVWYEMYSTYSADVVFKLDHDVAVTSVDASPKTVAVGGPVTISVTVENQGKEAETFNVVAYYDGSTAATTTVQNLASDSSRTLTLTWDTTGVTPKTYVIRAEAILDGDQDPSDNTAQDGTVTVQSAETQFPMEYIIIAVVIIVVIAIGVFLFLRRRKAPAT